MARSLDKDHRIFIPVGNRGNSLGQLLYFVFLIFSGKNHPVWTGASQQLTFKDIYIGKFDSFKKNDKVISSKTRWP